MTDQLVALNPEMEDAYLDLLTDYLSRELDPEMVAAVNRRLEEDSAFRKFAAPILAAWFEPAKELVVSPADIERSWAALARRTGIGQPKPRRRWGLRLLIVLVTVGIATFGARAVMHMRAERAAAAERAKYAVVPSGGRDISIAPGVAIRVPEGTRVRMSHPTGPGAVDTLRVLGSATVGVVSDRLTFLIGNTKPLVAVKTLSPVTLSDKLVIISALSDTAPAAIYIPALWSASEPAAIRPVQPRPNAPAIQPVTVVPGPPDGIRADTLPPDGSPPPKKRGKHYWAKSVAFAVAMVLSEALIR